MWYYNRTKERDHPLNLFWVMISLIRIRRKNIMKLKKIAALALAGVMAVSMLAGCAGKGTGDSKPTTGTASVAAEVATELNKNTTYKDKLSAAYSASLQDSLDKVVAMTGVKTDATTVERYLSKVDTSLTSTSILPTVGKASALNYAKDSAVQKTYGAVVVNDASNTLNEKGAASALVTKLQSKGIYDNTTLGSATNLPTKGTAKLYYDYVNGEYQYYHFDYSYTLEVAVSKVEDVVNGSTLYVAAYVVTRTPSKVAD